MQPGNGHRRCLAWMRVAAVVAGVAGVEVSAQAVVAGQAPTWRPGRHYRQEVSREHLGQSGRPSTTQGRRRLA